MDSEENLFYGGDVDADEEARATRDYDRTRAAVPRSDDEEVKG